MKKLGIIGGMGPLASQLLYKEIIEKTDATKDQEHIDMIILNHASMPDRTEAIKSSDTDKVKNLLLADIEFLEHGGVEVVAIPCNTSHYFIEELQKKTKLSIINMVRETVEKIVRENRSVKKIGVLATDGTVFSGIYERECKRLGVEYFVPDEVHQKIVMKIIYEQIKKGIPGSIDDFDKIDRHLKENGCDFGILACTELSCFREQANLNDFYIDALDVLSDCAITLCDAKLKK